MQTKELLLIANQQCAALVFPLLEDLRTAPLVPVASPTGNHAHWVLGHLVVSEGGFRAMMDGTSFPVQAWQPMFGGGSKPVPLGEGYPAYDELLEQLKSMHGSTIAWMEEMTESDLDQASRNIPAGFEPFFGTWRQVLLMRAMHWMNHRGQLADCRSAAGRSPLMV
jgi:hypothetical protein